MKKRIALLICILLIMQDVSAFAYDYPSAFWGINTKYENAISGNNHSKIIEYGKQLIDLMKDAPEGPEKKNTLITRYNQVGASYAALRDYDNAAKIYSELYSYVSRYGEEFRDYVKVSKARMMQYTSEIAMYTNGGTSYYYGAVNEKENGVLFGICSNGATRSKLDNESMVLTYQELGQKLLTYNVGVVREAAEKGLAVEFALNCPREGTDIKNINKMESYLKEISDLFKKYSSVPFYLRFAAEFDIWTNEANPAEYVSAFRYVSNYFKNRNDNVAIVWSPNQVSGWHIDIDDYYPGDEYVDWVGMSLYAQKYFLGDPDQKEEYEVVFRSGANSNPVIAVREIVEKYGDRKPIMLSESGCGHKLVQRGEDATAFALQRLKEYYSYLPMIYPQIKLIAYFDWFVDAETEKNDYRLSSNAALQNEYLKLVKGRRFIQNKYSNTTDFAYRPVYDGIELETTFEVSCYAHLYDSSIKSVTYFIDDKYAGSSSELPYTAMIDASGYSGTHRLTAVAESDTGKTLVTESVIQLTDVADNITVKIDKEIIDFDQEPVLYNNRTMVPMRKIFEKLGARVEWNAATQTVTGTKGDRVVKVTIGQNTMYVNNRAVGLDAVPFILAGRTLVPARAVAEGLGCNVDWNEKNRLVSITSKTFYWSDWDEDLPSYVNEDLYYIEKMNEYRVRTRDKEYFTLPYKIPAYNYVREEKSYGNWSDWGSEYISSSDTREVDTRKVISPKRYFYAHYCTGNEPDASIRYMTANYNFCDECTYHELGWYDVPLTKAEKGSGYILYNSDGTKYRCSNSCYTWYQLNTIGGESTEYRSRPIYTEYVYWEWDGWSKWSAWDEDDPYDYYDRYDDSIDVEERTVYRYKEKG